MRNAARPALSSLATFAAITLAVLVAPPAGSAAEPPVGTIVDEKNFEQYAEYLNPTQQYMLRHGVKMPVTEYRKFEWHPVYKAATEKYAGQVRLSPDGRDIVNYVAGAPFPTIDDNDPQAGAKWMWNHEQGPKYTDNVGVGWNMELVNQNGERDAAGSRRHVGPGDQHDRSVDRGRGEHVAARIRVTAKPRNEVRAGRPSARDEPLRGRVP